MTARVGDMSTSGPFTSPRRADHIRNQATLLRAACLVFAEPGPDAPIEEIARSALADVRLPSAPAR